MTDSSNTYQTGYFERCPTCGYAINTICSDAFHIARPLSGVTPPIKAHPAEITALRFKVERLESALQVIQIEAEREKGNWTHLKRAIAVSARAALQGDKP